MVQTITAQAKYVRIPHRKVRFVADTIRGLSTNEAESHLMLSPRRPAGVLLKLLRSAIANAKNNFKLDPTKLVIKEIRVDQGPKMRRWTPRARGSVSIIEKKTSHVTIVLGVSDVSSGRYTILEKPKKKKDAESRKEGKKKRAEEDEISKRKREETQKTAHDTSKTKGGYFRKVFRRKSI